MGGVEDKNMFICIQLKYVWKVKFLCLKHNRKKKCSSPKFKLKNSGLKANGHNLLLSDCHNSY